MHSFKVGASMALLFSALVAAAPTPVLDKRAVGPSCKNSDFKKAIVDTHNAHRTYHRAGDLEWDSTLATYAEEQANKCALVHSGGPYGENIFAVWPGYDDWTEGSVDAVKSWVYEVENYDYSKPGFSLKTGHYTQAVWKDTTKVGCSWNTSPCDGSAYLFCEYSAGGNVDGAYTENVLEPEGH